MYSSGSSRSGSSSRSSSSKVDAAVARELRCFGSIRSCDRWSGRGGQDDGGTSLGGSAPASGGTERGRSGFFFISRRRRPPGRRCPAAGLKGSPSPHPPERSFGAGRAGALSKISGEKE